MDNDERLGLPSFSNWYRLKRCHASHYMVQEAIRLGQEAFTRTEEAASGLRKHAAAAGEEVDLSEEEKETVEFVLSRADDQLKRIYGDREFTLHKEERLWLRLGGRKVASGRIDRLATDGVTLVVQDLKTGHSPPDPEDIRPQLEGYAVIGALAYDCQTVITQIITRAYGVSEHRYDVAELARAFEEIRETLRQINDPEAQFSPAPKTCRYCPAINICPAVRTLVPRVPKEAVSLPDGEQAKILLDQIEVLERRIEAIKSYYFERLWADKSYSIPGWQLVAGAPRRSVTDWHTARKRLEEFLDASDLDPAESYKLSAIEKALGKKLKLRGEALSAKFAEILNGLLEYHHPQPTLRRTNGH